MASRQEQESALAKAMQKIGCDTRDVLNAMDARHKFCVSCKFYVFLQAN